MDFWLAVEFLHTGGYPYNLSAQLTSVSWNLGNSYGNILIRKLRFQKSSMEAADQESGYTNRRRISGEHA